MTEEQTQRKSFYDEMVQGQTEKFSPKKVKNLQVEMVNLRPSQAKYILKYYNNTESNPNRKPSKVLVTKYASDMRNGYWKKTGQTLQFSSDGMLMDGQHRLLACVKTEMPQDFIVVYGLDKTAFDVIDNGKSRSYGDIASIKGFKDPALVTSLARLMIVFNDFGAVDADEKQFRGAGINQITKTQVMEFLDKNPNIGKFMEKYRKNNLISPVVAGFVYWMLQSDNKTLAEQYLDQVLLGYSLKPDTIQSYVFSKLQRNRNSIQNKLTKKAVIYNLIEGYRRVAGYSKVAALSITFDPAKGIPKLP